MQHFKVLYDAINGEHFKLTLQFLKLIEQIRRQSTTELQKFKARWEKAVEEDKNWVDPFKRSRRPRPPKKRQDTVQPA